MRTLTATSPRRSREKTDVAMTAEDWDKARGVDCSECGREAFQIRDGLCPRCYNRKKMKQDLELEEKATRRSYSVRLRAGTVSLAEMRESL